MGVVEDSVEDGVGDGLIGQMLVPFLRWQLARHDGGSLAQPAMRPTAPWLFDAGPAEHPRDASDAAEAPADAVVDAPGDVGETDDGRAADGDVDVAGDGRECLEDGAPATPRVLGAAFLHISSQPMERIYSGPFKLGPCERLVNYDAAVIYTQDQGSIPPLTAGLTILHTFDPAGPGMTSPAAQPPGKYYIDSPAVTYDAVTDTYKYSLHAVNFVTCPGPGACQYIDSTNYRVVIDIH